MLTVETKASNPLTVTDLAPLRRMLGAHSMVIRVNGDGTLMPFEIMPDLFLGRTIRQLLTSDVRAQFEAVCTDVAATQVAQIFVPHGFGPEDEVMVTPILDDAAETCQFLVCWARRQGEDGEAPVGAESLAWTDLELAAVDVRFRAIGKHRIEASPFWSVGDGIDLWTHHHRVSSVGLGAGVMADVVTSGIETLAAHDEVTLRVDVPAADMLNGLLQLFHGSLKAMGVDADRIVVGVPVDIAVDPDLLPLIVHLRTLGLQIDIVGLDALTAKLHTVSDTSSHRHSLPAVDAKAPGEWTEVAAAAVREARDF